MLTLIALPGGLCFNDDKCCCLLITFLNFQVASIFIRTFSMTNQRQKIFKLAKGYYKKAKNCYTVAVNRVEKGLQHAYYGRKVKKRNFRKLWIRNINASTTEIGVKYSQFMHGLVLSNVSVNRKMIADLARNEPLSMRSLISLSVLARQALSDKIRPKKVFF